MITHNIILYTLAMIVGIISACYQYERDGFKGSFGWNIASMLWATNWFLAVIA